MSPAVETKPRHAHLGDRAVAVGVTLRGRSVLLIVGIIVIGLLGALLDQIASVAGRSLTSWSDVRRQP